MADTIKNLIKPQGNKKNGIKGKENDAKIKRANGNRTRFA